MVPAPREAKMSQECTVYGGDHHYERGGEEGLEYLCECGAHCPHKWPDDIREEGGGNYCLLCGADGLG